jgi:hypothetical protein
MSGCAWGKGDVGQVGRCWAGAARSRLGEKEKHRGAGHAGAGLRMREKKPGQCGLARGRFEKLSHGRLEMKNTF